MMNEFKIITICGSMQFYDLMLQCSEELTKIGFIVLMPFVSVTEGDPDLKALLDNMHLSKIDLSDGIAVVSDETGYYGESTTKEIQYAVANNKEVQFFNVKRSTRKHGE